MPEYDAFGREIGEDPLAQLRDATVAEPRAKPAPRPEPAGPEPAAPEPAVTEPPPPRFVRPARRRRGVVFAPLIVVVALVGVLAALVGVVGERIEGGLEALVPPESAPRGLEPRSMVRAANLAGALEQMRASGLGRPITLRVAPSRVDARLVAGNGRLSLVRVTPQQDLRTLQTRTGGRARTGIAYGRIDVTVPERLVRASSEEGRRVRFLRFDRSGWRAYLPGGDVRRG